MFGILKSIFRKNIRVAKNINDDFIYLFPNGRRKYKIGNNIIIKPGFNAVFVVRGKVADVLTEGKYRLDWNLLSESARLMKLYKKKKMPKKFRVSIYFVNIKLFNEFEFKSNKPFVFKTASFGKVIGNSSGICSVQISNAKMLLNIMLKEKNCISNKIAKQLISFYVGNEINLRLEHSKMNFEEILNSNKVVNNYLNEVMIDALFEVGLRVSNVNFNAIQTETRRQQNKINNYIAYQCEYNFDKEKEYNSVLNINECLNVKKDNESYVYVSNEKNRPQDKITICPNCKARVSGRFCNNCGIKIY